MGIDICLLNSFEASPFLSSLVVHPSLESSAKCGVEALALKTLPVEALGSEAGTLSRSDSEELPSRERLLVTDVCFTCGRLSRRSRTAGSTAVREEGLCSVTNSSRCLRHG